MSLIEKEKKFEKNRIDSIFKNFFWGEIIPLGKRKISEEERKNRNS